MSSSRGAEERARGMTGEAPGCRPGVPAERTAEACCLSLLLLHSFSGGECHWRFARRPGEIRERIPRVSSEVSSEVSSGSSILSAREFFGLVF